MRNSAFGSDLYHAESSSWLIMGSTMSMASGVVGEGEGDLEHAVVDELLHWGCGLVWQVLVVLFDGVRGVLELGRRSHGACAGTYEVVEEVTRL